MNGARLLEVLSYSAEQLHEHYGYPASAEELLAGLQSITNSTRIALPARVPEAADSAVEALRSHFDDDVSLVSAALSFYFPDEYYFYRVSTYDRELVASIDLILQGFRAEPLPFETVGRQGFDRYLLVNDFLKSAAQVWSDEESRHSHVQALLYGCLAPIFIEPPDHHRAWIMAARREEWDALDRLDGSCDWSGRKEMQMGDFVLMYRTSPTSAITDVFVVNSDGITIDPWYGWDGIEVGMDHLGRIPDLPIAQMKSDAVLQEWGAVRKNFQGIVTESIPLRFFNRLVELLPASFREEHGLHPDASLAEGLAGDFRTEAEFEERVILPLVRRWGLRFDRQLGVKFQIGTSIQEGIVDFHLSDERGPVTLFENKLSITTEANFDKALYQAMSYALQLGLPSFVVAAPEGMWLYRLKRGAASLALQLDGSQIDARSGELLEAIHAIRDDRR